MRPKSLQIMSRTIKIKYTDKLVTHGDALGHWNPDKSTITVQKGLDPDLEFHTICHEIAHAASEFMGHKAVSEDEEKIDLIGNVLAQILKTLK